MARLINLKMEIFKQNKTQRGFSLEEGVYLKCQE